MQRREQARLRAAIEAGRYAPTLSDARQLYPGRKINTLYDPASRAAVFVPEKIADPDLEAEAVQVIQNAFHHAQLTGNRAILETALDDPAVRQVSRMPGNQASIVFERTLEALNSSGRAPAAREEPIAYTGVNSTAAQVAAALQKRPLSRKETGAAVTAVNPGAKTRKDWWDFLGPVARASVWDHLGFD